MYKKNKESIDRIILIVGMCLFALAIPIFNSILPPIQNKNYETTQYSDIKCVDGDTFWLDDDKIRLLGIDTPEVTRPAEPYGYEAKNRTCDLITGAENIQLLQDKGNETDKYERSLYWVYIDGLLLQQILVDEGLAEVKYIDTMTVNYDILVELEKGQAIAENNSVGIWSLPN